MRVIRLENRFSSLEVLPDLGGSIKSYHFKIGEQCYPVLRQSSEPKSAGDCACFPLVPFSNRIKNGRFSWQDKLVQLPLNHPPEKHALHGFGWQSAWQVASQTNEKVVLNYNNSCDAWPYDFEAQQTISLLEYGLEIKLEIINLSEETMPCGAGFHPYFTKTPKVMVAADISKMWAVDDECLPTSLVNAPFIHSENPTLTVNEHVLDNAFINPSAKASIVWPEWGVKADIAGSKNCQFFVCYSPVGEDFFCLEPVTNCTDAFNRFNAGDVNTGTEVLPPHAMFKTQMTIKLQPV